MIRAVILPGMDGTSELLFDIVAALAPGIRAEGVSYPADSALDYDALTRIAGSALPRHGKFLLIAESFSGPVGVRLARLHRDRLLGFVLCASFAKAPRIPKLPLPTALLGRIGARLPLHLAPPAVLSFFMMGRWTTPAWHARMHAARRKVGAQTIRRRVLDVTRVDDLALLDGISVPVLYLQATRDRIVTDASWKAVRSRAPHAKLVEIDGPHFLFQAKPGECAAAIGQWAIDNALADG